VHNARNGLRGICTVLVLLCVVGCSATVIPPEVKRGGAPVFLLDHGRHSSLVLSTPDNHIVRYSYGDWTYYALADTGPYRGSSALLWPTPGTLGCRQMAGPPTVEAVKQQVAVPIVHIYPLVVEQSRIEKLRRRLNEVFQENIDTLLYNPLYDLYFVHDPHDYNILHDSNHVVATWLKALGCKVHGVTLLSDWRVEKPK
jgi:hypothetical protein